MGRGVAILGVGMTRIEGAKKDQKLDDMVFEASSKALAEASVTRDDIDSVVISGCDETLIVLSSQAVTNSMEDAYPACCWPCPQVPTLRTRPR